MLAAPCSSLPSGSITVSRADADADLSASWCCICRRRGADRGRRPGATGGSTPGWPSLPRRRHGGVHGDRLFDQRLHQPVLTVLHPPLLSAAVRWGWRETALTATVVLVLYLIGGPAFAAQREFELQRFVVRSGHLVILSALLIWFGIHQRFAPHFSSGSTISIPAVRDGGTRSPVARLRNGASQAAGGALSWAGAARTHATALPFAGPTAAATSVASARSSGRLREPAFGSVLLFDVARGPCADPPARGRFRFARASPCSTSSKPQRLGLTKGVIAEISHRHAAMAGWSCGTSPTCRRDFVDFGARARPGGRRHCSIATPCSTAIEAGAAARTRLSLARDVHDSIVQFLAGAAFRIEAIKRAARSRRARSIADLEELKRLLGRGAERNPRLRHGASPRPRS